MCRSERRRAGYPGEQRATHVLDERDGGAESTVEWAATVQTVQPAIVTSSVSGPYSRNIGTKRSS
jgi:hypothetical protein